MDRLAQRELRLDPSSGLAPKRDWDCALGTVVVVNVLGGVDDVRHVDQSWSTNRDQPDKFPDLQHVKVQ